MVRSKSKLLRDERAYVVLQDDEYGYNFLLHVQFITRRLSILKMEQGLYDITSGARNGQWIRTKSSDSFSV